MRGGRRQPAGQRGRLAELIEVLDEQQPHVLPYILKIMAAEPIPSADCIDQRGVTLHDLVPRTLVTFGGTTNQRND
jgi:hypothetical protein